MDFKILFLFGIVISKMKLSVSVKGYFRRVEKKENGIYSNPTLESQSRVQNSGCGAEKQQLKNQHNLASLVAQWLRICLSRQGTWVRALVREDPTCHGATKPVRHSY